MEQKVDTSIKINIKDFLDLYKPNKQCKYCLGRGYQTFVYPMRMKDGINVEGRRKDPCRCTTKQIPDGVSYGITSNVDIRKV